MFSVALRNRFVYVSARVRSKSYASLVVLVGTDNSEATLQLILIPSSGHGVSSVNSEVCTRYIPASITQQESHSSHQIFWSTHLAHWNQRGPLFLEVWIIVQNSPGSEGKILC